MVPVGRDAPPPMRPMDFSGMSRKVAIRPTLIAAPFRGSHVGVDAHCHVGLIQDGYVAVGVNAAGGEFHVFRRILTGLLGLEPDIQLCIAGDGDAAALAVCIGIVAGDAAHPPVALHVDIQPAARIRRDPQIAAHIHIEKDAVEPTGGDGVRFALQHDLEIRGQSGDDIDRIAVVVAQVQDVVVAVIRDAVRVVLQIRVAVVVHGAVLVHAVVELQLGSLFCRRIRQVDAGLDRLIFRLQPDELVALELIAHGDPVVGAGRGSGGGIIDLEVLPAVLDLPPVESVALGQVGGDREGLSALGQVHPAGFAVADHDEDILEVEVVGPRVGAGFALGPEPALLCLRRRLGPPV